MMNRLFKEYSHASPMASIGWLFADLLLALAMLFLAANTVAIRPVTPPPPVLTANTMKLDAISPQCTNTNAVFQCQITLGETLASVGKVEWHAGSDLSDIVAFKPSHGIFSPGQHAVITLSNFPCHNGSFIFSGSSNVKPLLVQWRCNPPQERLDFNYQEFAVHVQDINGLLNNSNAVISDIEKQIKSQATLQNRSVGLAIVYAGAPDIASISTAQAVATKIYSILQSLGTSGFAFQRASYYVPLYALGSDANTVTIDVYLFQS